MILTKQHKSCHHAKKEQTVYTYVMLFCSCLNTY